MYCPQCGTPNAEIARFCEKCGSPIATAASATAPQPPSSPASYPGQGGVGPAVAASAPPYQAPPPPPQTFADPRIRGGASYTEAGPQNVSGGQRYAVGKDPTIALLLSLFLSPVGQFYNGDIKKALAIIAGYVVGAVLTMVYIGAFLILGLWVWSFIDAYNVAKQKTPLW